MTTPGPDALPDAAFTDPASEFYIPAVGSLTDRRTRTIKHADTFAVFDPHGALALRKQHAKRDQVDTEVVALTKENEQLKKEIDQLRHDPATIERIAREQLKLVKPGEIILVPAKN